MAQQGSDLPLLDMLTLDVAQCTALKGKLDSGDVAQMCDVLGLLRNAEVTGCLLAIAKSNLGKKVNSLRKHQDVQISQAASAVCAHWKTLMKPTPGTATVKTEAAAAPAPAAPPPAAALPAFSVDRLRDIIEGSAGSVGMEGDTPLIDAVRYGDYPSMVEFLAHGDNVNESSEDGSGTTALHVACQKGYKKFVAKLLAAKADANQARSDGITPLILASEKGWKRCLLCHSPPLWLYGFHEI